MQTKLSAYCERLLEATWLAVVVVVPLYFNIFSARVFEPDKLTLLRGLALFMALVAFVRFWETAPSSLGEVGTRLRSAFLRGLLSRLTLVFLGVYILCTVLSIAPVFSFWGSYQRLQGLLSVVSYIVLFFVVSQHLTRREQVERLITVLLLTSIPIALYGVVQHLGLDPLPWTGNVTARVTGTMGNAIFLAAYFIMVIPFALARLVAAIGDARSAAQRNLWTTARPVLYGLLLLLLLVVTVLTQSRGPWLGLLAGLALFVLLFLLRERRLRQFWISLGVGVVALGLIALLNIPNSPLYGLKHDSPYLSRLGSMLETTSATAQVRLLIWRGDGVGTGTLGLITANPFRTIVGYGPETMNLAFNPFYPPALAHLESRNASPDRSHDDYLDSIVTTGVIGLLAQLALLGTFFVLAVRNIWRVEEYGLRLVLLAVLAAVAAHAVEVTVGIAIAATLTYFWLDLAIVAAVAIGSLRWVPAPIVSKRAEQIPTASVAPTASRARRRRGKSARQTPTAERAAQPYSSLVSTSDWIRYAPLAGYMVVSFLLILWLLLLGQGRTLQPPVLVIGTFAWILLGVLITAWQIQPPSRPAPLIAWRADRWWLYGVVVLAAVFSTVAHVLSPVIADVYYSRGLGYEQANIEQPALSSYISAVRWNSYQDYYDIFLARLLMTAGQAAPDKPASLQLNSPSDVYKLGNLSQIGRQDLFKASLLTLTKARTLSPLSTDNYANLGRLYSVWGDLSTSANNQTERRSLASSAYQTATHLSPNLAYLYDEWGAVLIANKSYDQARQVLQHGIKLDNRYAPLASHMGDLDRAMGRTDQAVARYKAALQIDPNLSTAYVGMGYALDKQGKTQDALNAMLKAAQLSPQDGSIHRNLAVLYNELKMPDKALAEAQIALQSAPPQEQQEMKTLIADLQKSKG